MLGQLIVIPLVLASGVGASVLTWFARKPATTPPALSPAAFPPHRRPSPTVNPISRRSLLQAATAGGAVAGIGGFSALSRFFTPAVSR